MAEGLEITLYDSASVEKEEDTIDESNLFDVPLVFDPTNSYLEKATELGNSRRYDKSQQVLHIQNQRGKSLSTASVVGKTSIAFKMIKLLDGYDFYMTEVSAQRDMDQLPDILKGWEIEERIRSNGRPENFYRHVNASRQFRSLLEVKRYIRNNLDLETTQAQQEDQSSQGLQVKTLTLDKSSEASVTIEKN